MNCLLKKMRKKHYRLKTYEDDSKKFLYNKITLKSKKEKLKISKQNIHFNGFILFFIFIIITILILNILHFKQKYKEKISLQELIKNEIENLKNNEIYFDNNDIINIQSISNVSDEILQKDIDKEFQEMQEYIYMSINGTLINKNEIFIKSENPKISIIISVYNAEQYLKNAITSIHNQDFKDIEIIIVDDCSKDNTVNVIKELMEKDPRISFYQNKENKGTLYTKTKGVLLSKGKYVMILDQDDIYTQKDCFSTLYNEIEKNNLDFLGFASLFRRKIDLQSKKWIHHYYMTNIMYQPQISSLMYTHKKNGKVIRIGDVIWCYIFKNELFKNVIEKIDDKFMISKMICHEDFLLFFLLTRNAKSYKNIKRIFYIHINWKYNRDEKIRFSRNEKNKNKEILQCNSYLNYIEFLLEKTDNTYDDKKIASFEYYWIFINHRCRNNTFVRERGIRVSKLYLENEFISNDIKNKIILFLNETK